MSARRSRVSSPAPKVAARGSGAVAAHPTTSLNTTNAKEWRPNDPIKYAPVFQPSEWSPRALAKYFFGYPGYIWPWNCIYLAVAYLTYEYTNPNPGACYQVPLGCTLVLSLRNNVLLWIFAGGYHFFLYQRKINGTNKKYDLEWPATDSSKFLFRDQVYDNVFWSCVSGAFVWAAYEALFILLWGFKQAPVYYDWWSRPYYSFGLLVAIPFWREFHFYWSHRMLHLKPCYRWFHYLHHRNTNPGPWSGLSMHPVEHILYFSVVLVHLFVESHPLHFIFNVQHTALTPAGGHHGFHGPVWKDRVPTGSYFHYLHHRYFECNYGESTIPLDRWFGTFRDGQSVGTNIPVEGGSGKQSRLTTGLTVLVGVTITIVPLWNAICKLVV